MVTNSRELTANNGGIIVKKPRCVSSIIADAKIFPGVIMCVDDRSF